MNHYLTKCDFCAYDAPLRSPLCKSCTKFSNFKLKKRMSPREAYEWKQYELIEEFERGIKMAVKPCCDFCDKPLDVEDGRYVIYRTKELNTRELLPHLCKRCADGLDDVIRESRTHLMAQGDIIRRVSELNKERRELLGTKG